MPPNAPAESPVIKKDVPKNFHLSLKPEPRNGTSRTLTHLAAFSKGNAGDHLLPVTLRDLFDEVAGPSKWRLRNVRPLFDDDDIKLINRGRGVVLGGGGLFLRDRNENLNSGWQWNCSIGHLDAIRVPMVLFAVGYNRFRGQPDFEPIFTEHITRLTEKALYVGLRNTGSMRAIHNYVPESLHAKVRFQPCMTTLVRKLYPDLTEPLVSERSRPIISLNVAFDRAEFRFGDRELEILSNIASAMKKLSESGEIHLVVQGLEDDHIMPFMRATKVPCQMIDLRSKSPAEIVRYYSGVDLVFGMRGHAQMIPLGCGTPIVSLIGHDKVRWFLEDIEQTDWGIEVKDPNLTELMVAKGTQILANSDAVRARISEIQNRLWDVSVANVRLAAAAFGTDEVKR